MINLVFEGPYTFLTSKGLPSIFKSPLKRGVYIWTVPFKNKELIHYVGMTTREFRQRMKEHLKEYLSGEYGINDPVEMKKGSRMRIWDGLYRGANIEDFIKKHDQLFPKLVHMLNIYRIYVAQLDCETRLLERIEAAIAENLFNQDGAVGDFQEPDAHTHYIKIKRKSDERIELVKLKCPKTLLGLPQTLRV